MKTQLGLAVMLMALSCAASACLWDSDTLDQEAKGHLEFVRIVTGRFERNPPLYYEVRLARVRSELQIDPSNLLKYDDAGVACDRLGRDDEAIEWMAKKKRCLKSLPDDKDAWYRYYANLGTFHAHHWFRGGAKRESLAEMRTARILIAKAIEINPNAHFGRESVQLAVIEWAIALKEGRTQDTLGDYLASIEVESKRPNDRTVIGLLGLIALGNAWESVDTFQALALLNFLSGPSRSHLTHLAEQRMLELIDQGKVSLNTSLGSGAALKKRLSEDRISFLVDPMQAENERAYRILREEAEQYQRERTAYMISRLENGRHPDSDPTFWKDYQEPPEPMIPEPSAWHQLEAWAIGRGAGVVLSAICIGFPVLIAVVLWVTLRRRARRRKSMSMPPWPPPDGAR